MQLSNLTSFEGTLIKDGYFETLSQCTAVSKERTLTFIDDLKYINYIDSSLVSAVICTPELTSLLQDFNIGIITSDNPRLLFFEVHNYLSSHNHSVQFKTKIGGNSKISSTAYIADFNVSIGDNVIIEENVVIKEGTNIGSNCIIRSGSIIGGQGYEFKRSNTDYILRVVHVGKTIINDFVEIKENCTIHRAVFDWDSTSLGEYTKLDAHTHIGHGTKIGKQVMIGSHGNLSGNIIIKDHVNIGPSVTISNRLIIEECSKISIGSVVTKNVKVGTTVTGNFAIPHQKFIKNLKSIMGI